MPVACEVTYVRPLQNPLKPKHVCSKPQGTLLSHDDWESSEVSGATAMHDCRVRCRVRTLGSGQARIIRTWSSIVKLTNCDISRLGSPQLPGLAILLAAAFAGRGPRIPRRKQKHAEPGHWAIGFRQAKAGKRRLKGGRLLFAHTR